MATHIMTREVTHCDGCGAEMGVTEVSDAPIFVNYGEDDDVVAAKRFDESSLTLTTHVRLAGHDEDSRADVCRACMVALLEEAMETVRKDGR